MITPITDHVDAAVARLTSSFDNTPRTRALLEILVQPIQDIEDAIAAFAKSQLGEGTILQGVALDVLGRIVGLERAGLDDATYEALLLGVIGENNSDATPAAVIAVARQIFQAQAVFFADANAPVHNRIAAGATLSLGIGSPQTDASLFALLIRLLGRAIPAGVNIAYVTTFAADGALACAGPQSWVAGFAALDGTGGAPLAQLIYTDPQEIA